MKEDIREIFEDIRVLQQTGTNPVVRYRTLEQILVRSAKTLTRNYPVDFTNTATRLHWLCKECGHSALPLEIFRARAFQIRLGKLQPNKTDYAYDLKAVCEGIAAFYRTTIPDDIKQILPSHWRLTEVPAEKEEIRKRIRITVVRWDESFLYGKDNEHPDEGELKIRYTDEHERTFAALHTQLYEGAQLNLLSTRKKSNPDETDTAHPFILHPKLPVLDPDFLIDITSICACVRSYGTSPYTHILNKFSPSARSAAIQLGNAANQFLDDCVNEPSEKKQSEEERYLLSMQKSFKQSPLAYTTLPDIDKPFFEQCRKQFGNIRKTVEESFSAAEVNIKNTEVQLEPSFLCEALGIQGRMDLLTNDFSKLIELKSGKADEYPFRQPKEEHRLQMALYKEILYYNMERAREEVRSFLFYSRYPQFYAINAPKSEIRQAMALRNAIVHLERRLRNGESRQVLEELTEEKINVSGLNDRFYHQYLRPRIMETLLPLQNMEGIEADYFHCFLTFMEREQFLAKVGDDRPDSSNGFAETWHCDTAIKQQNGNILTDLSLHALTDEEGSVTHLRMDLPEYGEDFLPNFRMGDMVMLYERNSEQDIVTNKQFFRCVVENIEPESLLLKLSYKQRNSEVFHSDRLYAIEPGYMDASFNQAYSGLFQLLSAPQERKALLLGQRMPETNPNATLNKHYPNEEIDRIVLKAKQAEDYFLLVGPPGTGKTSVALKSMVEEFLADTPQKNILLMAYTNRAVDEICAMLSTLVPEPEYVRIGQELNCAPDYRARLMNRIIEKASSRKEIYEKLHPIRVFTGTISSLCSHPELFCLKAFDVALIDEASQVLEPQLLPLLCATTDVNRGDYSLARCAIGKFILIGDHKQLPAVVVQRPETSQVNVPTLNAIGLTDCRNSLFERLHRLSILKGNKDTVEMLHRQGRMHPAISDFVNHKFYNGKLDIVPLKHQTDELKYRPLPDNPFSDFIARTRIGFVNVIPDRNENNPKSNRNEAKAVASLIKTLQALTKHNGEELESSRQIGIIVPFRAQISMIRKAIACMGLQDCNDITIDTVERYQGSQRDIIIFSTTVSRFHQLETLSEPVMTEGQAVDRKLNVALTRARKQFFLVGNEALLRRCNAYRELLDFFAKPIFRFNFK